MATVRFGFTMPADQLDKTRRATYVQDLNRALTLISGHFDSAWCIDHLQFGDADVLDGEVARFVDLVSTGGVTAATADNARTAATLRTLERIRATFTR